MNSACLFAVLVAGVVLLNICHADPYKNTYANEPYGYCAHCNQVFNGSFQGLKGDYFLIYSTEVKYRKSASFWGGEFPYDFCDPLNSACGCMNTGFTFAGTAGGKDFGYTYSFNAFTEVWTLEQISMTTFTVPGTSYQGFRVNYNHYIQVDEKSLIVNGTVQACGSHIIRSGPIYRSANFMILTAAEDYSWIAVMYCDSFYGYVDENAPVIHIIVKRDLMEKVSYPFESNYFYEDIRAVVLKNNLNLYGADFNLMYHDQDGLYPTSVAWESVQWEADCLCTSATVTTGTATST